MELFEANGAKFIVKDDMIIRHLKRHGGKFEPATTEWMFDVLRDSAGLFLDVGVSTGWFAIPVAKMGKRVIGVEPNARVRARLVENAALNGVDVEIIAAAASNAAGETTFHYNRILPLTSGGSIEYKPTSDAMHETVSTITIDSLDLPEIALIKIDVEGHELSVLRGAAETIAKYKPALMLEANNAEAQARLSDWLDENGYNWFGCDVRNMLCTPK